MKKPEYFRPCVIHAEEARAIFNALSTSGHHGLAEALEVKARRLENDCLFVEAVLGLESDDFQVDDDPIVSRSNDGAYVMTWRWVSNHEAGIEEEPVS